jgi:hypothetical protein
LDEWAGGSVSVAEEDCCAGCGTAVGESEFTLDGAARVVGGVVEEGVGEGLALVSGASTGIRHGTVILRRSQMKSWR